MRRYVHILAVLAGLWAVAAFHGPARAEPLPTDQALADRVLGNPDAPVTIFDYSSLTCPHCATFHVQTLPKLKDQYLDTGKAKLVFRDFPFDAAALRGAMMARCAPKDRYYAVLDVLFKQQDKWTRAADPIKALAQLGKLAGISQADFDACMANQALADGILKMRMDGEQKYKVDSTPTFVLNDGAGRVDGAQPFEKFAEAIDKLSRK